MKQFLITVAGALVALILFLFILPIAIGAMIAGQTQAPPLPRAMVLTLDLRAPLPDQPAASPFGFGFGPSALEVITRLDDAAQDDRVKGLYLRGNVFGVAGAHAEELRAAIGRFRTAGKFVITHVQHDAPTASIGGYATIAGSDEIWAQPDTALMPMGFVAEAQFFGGTLAKYKVRAQVEKREEFKSAMDSFTETGFTPAEREATGALIDSLFTTFVASIAADREQTVEAVRAAIEATPYAAEEAVRRGLFDRLGYPEEAEAAALERAGADAEFVEIGEYSHEENEGAVIAVVAGDGAIISGPEEASFFPGDGVMNSDRIAAALDEAAGDEDVRAIVFRVNSPGGTIVASQQILAAVKRAQAEGKKVVVSMGPVAASGGYYVSASADEIVASASTVTGSIGVIGSKFVLGEALEHYFAVTSDAITRGSPVVNWVSGERPFSNAEQAFFKQYIDTGYAAFKREVANGRRLTPAQVDEIAKGRVWSGQQAKDRGLVDAVGGFDVAVERAKALAGIEADAEVQLQFYPAQEGPFEQLRDLFGVSAEVARAAAALGAVLGDERVTALLAAARETRDDAAMARFETTAPIPQ